jgi:hypothetical protein
MDAVVLAIAKKYAESLSSGIAGSSYDPSTSTMTVRLNDGTSYKIVFDDGITEKDRGVLDHVSYDETTGELLLNGVSLLTEGDNPTGGSSVLESDFIATTAIGMVTNGKKYEKGTSLETIIRDILTTYQKCGLTVTLNPATELYDAVTDTLDKININAKVTKGTNDVTEVSFFIDGAEMKENKTGVADGGDFSYEHSFATPTNNTFVVKVTATDGKQANTITKTITFIGKSYYGTVGESVVTPTEADVKGLQSNVLKNTRKLTYQHIAVDYGKVLYAYPASLGALTKIVDADGRDYTNSYTKSEVVVDGINYYAYLLTDAMGTDDGYQSYT